MWRFSVVCNPHINVSHNVLALQSGGVTVRACDFWVQTIGSNALTGIFYLVGGAVWTLESLWSFWTLKAVYGAFRGGGGDRRLKQEVASAVASGAASHASRV